MRDFYCKDCGTLIGQIEDNIITHCPKCRSLNNSANSIEHVTPDIGVEALRKLGKELELTFPVGTTKVEMAKIINDAKKA